MGNLSVLLSSEVKASIVCELFAAGAVPLHGRELARRCDASLSAVQRELKKLAAVGLIAETQDGNRTNYSANQQHPFYVELTSLVRKSDGITDAIAKSLQGCGAAVAFVFGSIADNSASAGSDVDLMVIGDVKLRQVVSCLSGVAAQVGREINPHVFSSDEWTERMASGDHFVSTVMARDKRFVIGGEDELERMAK